MIYLHIGRHKTGTTAIQQFLAHNRDRLHAQGVLYPDELPGTEAHYGIVLGLVHRRGFLGDTQRFPVPRNVDLEGLEPYLDEVNSRMASSATSTVSSEWFQKMDPRLVATFFPPGETTVVVYLREQLDYLLSAYAQRIKASLETQSFAEFVDAGGFYEYSSFLERWGDAFGHDRLRVRLYDRTWLEGGSSVSDFLHATGLAELDGLEPVVASEPNASLSALLIWTKRLLNRVLAPEQQQEWNLYSRFEVLAASERSLQRRIGISPELAADIRERYRDGNLEVSQRYFQSSSDVFHYAEVDPGEPLRDAEVTTMLGDLAEIAPEAHRLLLNAVEDESFVDELPEEERLLARAIPTVSSAQRREQLSTPDG